MVRIPEYQQLEKLVMVVYFVKQKIVYLEVVYFDVMYLEQQMVMQSVEN